MSYLDKSLKEIHEALKDGKVTSKELVEESLKRAHSNQEELNSFVTICDDAKELEVTDNVLSGIPYAVKDNLSTKGWDIFFQKYFALSVLTRESDLQISLKHYWAHDKVRGFQGQTHEQVKRAVDVECGVASPNSNEELKEIKAAFSRENTSRGAKSKKRYNAGPASYTGWDLGTKYGLPDTINVAHIEHARQSVWNYFGNFNEKITNPKEKFGRNLIKLPVPEFYVFYNGKEDYPTESEMKLSDAFIQLGDNSELKNQLENANYPLEISVKVININVDKENPILKRCEALKQYSEFIELCIALPNSVYSLPNISFMRVFILLIKLDLMFIRQPKRRATLPNDMSADKRLSILKWFPHHPQ